MSSPCPGAGAGIFERLTALIGARYAHVECNSEVIDMLPASHGIPPIRRSRLSSLVLLGLVALAACSSERAWDNPGPRETFKAFLMDLWRGNDEAAFAMLTPEDRERLTKPRQALEALVPPEAIPPEHEWLVAGRVDSPFDIRHIEVDPPVREEPKAGDTVRLKLSFQDERTAEATLVWSGERWHVTLPASQVDAAVELPEASPAPKDAEHDDSMMDSGSSSEDE